MRDADDEIEEITKKIDTKEVTVKQVSNHEFFKELDSKHIALQDDYKKLIKEKADLEFDVKFANRKIKSLNKQIESMTPKKLRKTRTFS